MELTPAVYQTVRVSGVAEQSVAIQVSVSANAEVMRRSLIVDGRYRSVRLSKQENTQIILPQSHTPHTRGTNDKKIRIMVLLDLAQFEEKIRKNRMCLILRSI